MACHNREQLSVLSVYSALFRADHRTGVELLNGHLRFLMWDVAEFKKKFPGYGFLANTMIKSWEERHWQFVLQRVKRQALLYGIG